MGQKSAQMGSEMERAETGKSAKKLSTIAEIAAAPAKQTLSEEQNLTMN